MIPWKREWKITNPTLAKRGNIRDFADLIHLVILNKIDLVNEYDLVKFINWLKDDVKKSVGNLKEFGIVLLDSRNNNIKRIVDREIDRLCNEIIKKRKS